MLSIFSNKYNDNMKKQVVLITGCGSGLGFTLASQLYNTDKYKVVATCRAHKLEALRSQLPEKNNFIVRELDVLNEKNISSLVNEICQLWGRIDVLVNNAAVCYRGVIEHMDTESELLQIKTNYLGPMVLIRSVLPIMRENHFGQIINVSSVSGVLSMPTMGSYSASKHALEGASESLWYEERPYGIKVNIIQLGFINSSSFENVIMSKKAKLSSMLKGPHSEFYHSMVPFITKLMRYSLSSPDTIAQKIISVIENKPSNLKVLATLDAYVFDFLRRILPTKLMSFLFYMLLPGSSNWGWSWKKNKDANHKSAS